MHSWFSKLARRRYRVNDKVRYFTRGLQGKGKNIVLTPKFERGIVTDFDSDTKRYHVQNPDGVESEVHPRNIVPDPAPTPIPRDAVP